MLAHWRLTPTQLKELSEEDLDVMNVGYRLYERRWVETLSDLIGALTGTSWSVDALTEEQGSELDEVGFNWKLRPDRQRVSLPLTLVVGGNKVMEHVKKMASDMKAKSRRDPSIISLPSASLLKDAEIVDLSKVTKDEFMRFAKGAEK